MALDRLSSPSANSTEPISSLRSAAQQQTDRQSQTLVLSTKHGNIRIRLRPDLSPESVEYILSFTSKDCDICDFYRSEKDLLLQGKMVRLDLHPRLPKGPCPPEFANSKQDCPKHDPNCACHGPTMTKGMVGWAGGKTGPDFFINVFDKPVDWWGQQHTVWGIVEDQKSLDLIRNQILQMPVQNNGGMHMLKEPFNFQMSLE